MSLQKLIRLNLSKIRRLDNSSSHQSIIWRAFCSTAEVQKSNKSDEKKSNQAPKNETIIKKDKDNESEKFELADKLCSPDGNWHISCGLVIQRFPLLVPEFNVIEKTLYEYNLKLEYEKSLLSEYDYAIEKVRNENSKDETYLQLVSNYEKYLNERDSFQTKGKKTEDDLNGNTKSYQRCLDRSLFLVTKFNIGRAPIWTFPLLILDKNDVSLREASERLLNQIDNKSKFRILGNSPFVHYTHRYSRKLRERFNRLGNKAFYFKCELIDLKNPINILNKDLILDYKWSTIDDCKSELDKNLWNKIESGLFVEQMDDQLLEIVNRRLSIKKAELSN